MFKEVLQIVPTLSPGDLNNMEKSLSSRFGTVAKKFGQGLLAVLTGGGIAGVALGLVNTIINPLKETQDAIDKAIKQGDDVVTNAKQFGTTAGKLFRLQQIAKSTGLDESSLFTLIEKFQGTVAEAKRDPNKVTSVRQFVDQKDTAEAFFQFIQALQKMDKTQQVLVQQEVFGEKQILKMADFLQTDFTKQTKDLGGPSAEKLTPALNKLGDLNDLKDLLEARRNLGDVMSKSRVITADMIKAQDEKAKKELAQDEKRIQSYLDLAAIADASSKIQVASENILMSVGKTGKVIEDLSRSAAAIEKSRAARGVIPGYAKER